MNVNIANLLTTTAPPGGQAPAAAKNGDSAFAAVMGASRQKHAGKAMFMQPRPSQTPEKNRAADFQACLNALRSAFLNKGKPFSKVSLTRDDAALLSDFLQLSGYGREAGKALVDGLLESSPAGRISLSRFLAGVKAAGPPLEKEKQAAFLDVSVAPYVESMLKAFNLSDEEISGIMNRGRRKDGGLDLMKVIGGMQAAGPGALAAGRGIIDPTDAPRAAETLAQLGLGLAGDSKSGPISIVDVARIMEKAAKGAKDAGRSLTIEDLKALNSRWGAKAEPGVAAPGPGGDMTGKPGVPQEVHEAIARVLEKATAGDRSDEDLTDIITGSKIRFEEPGSKSLSTAREAEAAKAKTPPQAQAVAAASQGQGEKAAGTALGEGMKAAGEAADSTEMNDLRGARVIEGRPMSGVVETSADSPHAKAPAGNVHGSEHRAQPSGDLLPRYVVGQLGSQIERSLARGDGIVRMRLKPAELGSVRLEMQVTENRMTISVAAENSKVRELLLSNVQELKELLQGQGIRLEKLDVNVGGDFNRTFSGLNEGGHSGNSRHGHGAGGAVFDGEDAGDTRLAFRARVRQDAMVDLVA